MQRLTAISAFLFVSAFSVVAYAQQECSEHGKLEDGKCVCVSPLPVDATAGWVGDTCSQPVHQLYLTGQDIEETCGAGHVCNVITPAEPVCFATTIEEMINTSYHMSLLLISNSVEAAVTLRGLLTNFTSEPDASTGGSKLVPQVYPTSAATFSFALHTTNEATTAQLHLTRRQLGYGAYTGLYLCAESTAVTTIVLRGATHSCPLTVKSDGSLRLCSDRGTSDTCPHGSCTCPAPYAPPPNWVVAPGLGFEDCTATLQPLQLSESQSVSGLASGAWSFFSLDWPAAADPFELQIAAAATEATKGQLMLFLRQGQLPGQAGGQHDVNSASLGAQQPQNTWARDLSAHIRLRRTDMVFRKGTWYLGVYNLGSGPVSYTLTSALHDCPNNCSGRGTCAPQTGTCTCEQPSMLAPDCSTSTHELVLGQTLPAPPRSFSHDLVTIPGVREALQGGGNSKLVLTASFSTSDAELPTWVTGRPLVMVSANAAALANITGSDGGLAALDGQEVSRLALAERGKDFSMELGPWMIADDGSLHALVWNPLTGPQRQVGYVLAVAAKVSCPGLCSGRGTCDEATGRCTCEAPFIGSDCSVDSSHLACSPGTRQPLRRPELRSTCWAACKADGSGYDDMEEACKDVVTCDPPADGHGPLRRKGTEPECVEDACAGGTNVTMADASGDFVCARRCGCPEDGGACSMEAECLPGSVQCLQGLRLDAASGRCVSGGCEEGSLRRSYELDGGSVMAVCVCTAAGDPASCAYTAPTQSGGNAGGVVSCLPGFQRQGSTASTRLSDGAALVTGGSCGRPPSRRAGVSGGMVFFYCLLSIFLAAGLVVGGKYGMLWYDQYRYGRSVFSQGYVSWPLFGGRGQGNGGTDDW